jgi:hypothetical protein
MTENFETRSVVGDFESWERVRREDFGSLK